MFAVPPELIDTPHAHDPVMLREVLSSAAIPAGAIVIDGTFGRGGYARAGVDALLAKYSEALAALYARHVREHGGEASRPKARGRPVASTQGHRRHGGQDRGLL